MWETRKKKKDVCVYCVLVCTALIKVREGGDPASFDLLEMQGTFGCCRKVAVNHETPDVGELSAVPRSMNSHIWDH